MIPIVFAFSVVRAGCATRTTRFAVRLSLENAAAAIAFAVAGDVELQSGRRRPDHDLAGRRDLEVRVLRLAGDGRREALEVLLGSAAPDRDLGAAALGQVERSGAMRQRGTRQRVSP